MKWICCLLVLILFSCSRKNINKDDDVLTETTTKYGGEVIFSLRDYVDPPANMDVTTVSDTQYAVAKVHIRADSIDFFSENDYLPNHSALISDSLGGQNRYMVSTIRPISYYQLRGDSLVFWSSVADPTGGPYYKKVTYNGLKM